MSGAERDLLDQGLTAMTGCARRLERSRGRLYARFPLSPAAIASPDAALEDELDAFMKRFEQLVTAIQDQVFRGVALAEQEDLSRRSRRDVTELMEKIGALPSAERFRRLAEARNRLAHLYPHAPERQAANLNAAFDGTAELLAAADVLAAFVRERHARG